MGCRDVRVWMLGEHALENPAHLFFREAFVRLVVKMSDRLALGVVTHHAVKDADGARSVVLDGPPHTLEIDRLLGDTAELDRGTSCHGWKNVDSVTIPQCLRRVDEVAVHRKPHTLEVRSQCWKTGADGVSKLVLGEVCLRKLEGGAVTSRELLGGRVIVDMDLHAARIVAGLEKQAAEGAVIEFRAVTESGVKLICWIGAAAMATATLAVPQPVEPWEMPSLRLDRAEASDAIRVDEALAAEAGSSSEAEALRTLFLDHGLAETNPPYETIEYDKRQAAIHQAMRALVERHGASAIDALRAQAVEEFAELFYHGQAGNEEAAARLGGFPEIARRYGLVHQGVIVAPELTVRALYKARWNAIHRRPFVDGFSKIELQAYWGWLALHGWGTPLQRREDALVAFRDAGGIGTEEAAALFDLLSGRPERAASSLQSLYAARGELRLRNLGLGALHAAISEGRGP